VLEALLFTSGKPMAAADLVQASGLSDAKVRKGLEELTKAYEARASKSALEVSKVGAKFALRLRPEFRDATTATTPTEIPRALVKTLALIAYHQPVKQSELVSIIGPKVYEQVPTLQETGLIVARRYGMTKLLMTSKGFPEYFGIPITGREAIRRYMAKALGVGVPKPKRLTVRMGEILGEQDKEDAEGTDEALADADLAELLGGGSPADLADAMAAGPEDRVKTGDGLAEEVGLEEEAEEEEGPRGDAEDSDTDPDSDEGRADNHDDDSDEE